MDSFREHLLILDEVTDKLAKHAISRAEYKRDDSHDDYKTYQKQADVAKKFGRERDVQKFTDKSHEAFAKYKHFNNLGPRIQQRLDYRSAMRKVEPDYLNNQNARKPQPRD